MIAGYLTLSAVIFPVLLIRCGTLGATQHAVSRTAPSLSHLAVPQHAHSLLAPEVAASLGFVLPRLRWRRLLHSIRNILGGASKVCEKRAGEGNRTLA